MHEDLLASIRERGHWRIVLRPLTPLDQKLSFKECEDLLQNLKVSLRGWDYPHVNRRNDEHGGTERGDDYFESWCDWDKYLEFCRMYRSGQFVSYNALREDAEIDRESRDRWLDTVGAIYSVTEFVEFAHRLAGAGTYQNGYLLDISLKNNAGRKLNAGPGRMPFSDGQTSGAETIRLERRVEPDAIKAGAISTSLDVLVELFDSFGWNPDKNQIRTDQEAFYRRDFC